MVGGRLSCRRRCFGQLSGAVGRSAFGSAFLRIRDEGERHKQRELPIAGLSSSNFRGNGIEDAGTNVNSCK